MLTEKNVKITKFLLKKNIYVAGPPLNIKTKNKTILMN